MYQAIRELRFANLNLSVWKVWLRLEGKHRAESFGFFRHTIAVIFFLPAASWCIRLVTESIRIISSLPVSRQICKFTLPPS